MLTYADEGRSADMAQQHYYCVEGSRGVTLLDTSVFSCFSDAPLCTQRES